MYQRFQSIVQHLNDYSLSVYKKQADEIDCTEVQSLIREDSDRVYFGSMLYFASAIQEEWFKRFYKKVSNVILNDLIPALEVRGLSLANSPIPPSVTASIAERLLTGELKRYELKNTINNLLCK